MVLSSSLVNKSMAINYDVLYHGIYRVISNVLKFIQSSIGEWMSAG